MATRKPAPAGPLVLDSSCWLEVFGVGLHAGNYEAVIAKPAELLVPIITVYEVYKYLRRVKGEAPALRAAHYMEQGKVIAIDWAITLAAAGNGGLPMADSLIYATAQAHGATLWTQDAHFQHLPGVRYFAQGL